MDRFTHQFHIFLPSPTKSNFNPPSSYAQNQNPITLHTLHCDDDYFITWHVNIVLAHHAFNTLKITTPQTLVNNHFFSIPFLHMPLILSIYMLLFAVYPLVHCELFNKSYHNHTHDWQSNLFIFHIIITMILLPQTTHIFMSFDPSPYTCNHNYLTTAYTNYI